MAIYKVPGLKEAVATTDTAPRSTFQPFPAAAPSAKFGMKHTAKIEKVEIFIDTVDGNDKIVAHIVNGDCQGRIYTQLDPSRVSPANVTPKAIEEAVERNTKALALAVATYGIANANGDIDDRLFAAAVGRLVTIAVKDSGKVNAKGYPTVYTNLLGRADELTPVDPALASLASASRPAPTAAAGPVDDGQDIPF